MSGLLVVASSHCSLVNASGWASVLLLIGGKDLGLGWGLDSQFVAFRLPRSVKSRFAMPSVIVGSSSVVMIDAIIWLLMVSIM